MAKKSSLQKKNKARKLAKKVQKINYEIFDCPVERVFITAKGETLKNLSELVECMKNMDDWTFRYHVNSDFPKNDFAAWIREVFCDAALADKLNKVLDKDEYFKIIVKHIK
ncbi:MAG: DUF5752 family protein [archaeon]